MKIDDDDELEVEHVKLVSATAPGGKILGRLTIGTGTVTVTDDHMSLVLKVPSGFDLSKFRPATRSSRRSRRAPSGRSC